MEPEPETGGESKVIVIDTETLSVVKQCHSTAVISEDKINKTIQFTTIYSIYYNIFNILQHIQYTTIYSIYYKIHFS